MSKPTIAQKPPFPVQVESGKQSFFGGRHQNR